MKDKHKPRVSNLIDCIVGGKEDKHHGIGSQGERAGKAFQDLQNNDALQVIKSVGTEKPFVPKGWRVATEREQKMLKTSKDDMLTQLSTANQLLKEAYAELNGNSGMSPVQVKIKIYLEEHNIK